MWNETKSTVLWFCINWISSIVALLLVFNTALVKTQWVKNIPFMRVDTVTGRISLQQGGIVDLLYFMVIGLSHKQLSY